MKDTKQKKGRRRARLDKAPRGVFPFRRVRFRLLIFFLVGRFVLGAHGVVLVSWGAVPVASATVGRFILTIALARRASSFGVPSSWLIGAPGVSPFASLLTLVELGDLIVRNLAKAITINLHELFLDNLQASALPGETGPRGALSLLKATSRFHILEDGKLHYGS